MREVVEGDGAGGEVAAVGGVARGEDMGTEGGGRRVGAEADGRAEDVLRAAQPRIGVRIVIGHDHAPFER